MCSFVTLLLALPLLTSVASVTRSSHQNGKGHINFLEEESFLELVREKTVNTLLNCSDNDTCPPWLYCSEGKCECGNDLQGMIKCSVNKTLSVLDCNCVTYTEEEELAEVGKCIYNCGHFNKKDAFDMLYNPFAGKLFTAEQLHVWPAI